MGKIDRPIEARTLLNTNNNNTNSDSFFDKIKKLNPFTKKMHSFSPREELIADLKEYIDRIEKLPEYGHSLIYSHDFLIFKDSRGLNREANYRLAKRLFKTLTETATPIEEVFRNIKARRTNIIYEFCLNLGEKKEITIDKATGVRSTQYKDRGINSRELNKIIGKANKFIEQERVNQSTLKIK